MSSLPLAEVIGVRDFSEIRAISKNIEKLLPERKQGAICLPDEEEGSIIWRAMRGAVSARCGHLRTCESHVGVRVLGILGCARVVKVKERRWGEAKVTRWWDVIQWPFISVGRMGLGPKLHITCISGFNKEHALSIYLVGRKAGTALFIYGSESSSSSIL